MKKIIVGLGLLLCSSPCRSWEFANNPDRFPSIGLNYGMLNTFGGFKETTSVTNYDLNQAVKFNTQDIILDGRFPVSDRFTLNLSGGLTSIRLEGRDISVAPQQAKNFINGGSPADSQYATNSDMFGYNFSIGLRFYFH